MPLPPMTPTSGGTEVMLRTPCPRILPQRGQKVLAQRTRRMRGGRRGGNCARPPHPIPLPPPRRLGAPRRETYDAHGSRPPPSPLPPPPCPPPPPPPAT